MNGFRSSFGSMGPPPANLSSSKNLPNKNLGASASHNMNSNGNAGFKTTGASAANNANKSNNSSAAFDLFVSGSRGSDNKLLSESTGEPSIASFIAPNTIGSAVNNIVNWATVIMKGIEIIQWREIGFEQNNDGSPNLSRPLYSIPNPNSALSEIVDQYSQSVVGSLRFLQSIAENERLQHINEFNGDISQLEGADNELPSDKLPSESFVYANIPNMSRSFGTSGNSDHLYNAGSSATEPTRLMRDSSTASLGFVEKPNFSRNNSLYLDQNEMAIPQPLPIPTLMSSFSSSWGGYNNMFDVSVASVVSRWLRIDCVGVGT